MPGARSLERVRVWVRVLFNGVCVCVRCTERENVMAGQE